MPAVLEPVSLVAVPEPEPPVDPSWPELPVSVLVVEASVEPAVPVPVLVVEVSVEPAVPELPVPVVVTESVSVPESSSVVADVDAAAPGS